MSASVIYFPVPNRVLAPVRLDALPDEVASAMIRGGVAAAADPSRAGALGAGAALAGDLVEIVIQHGANGRGLLRIVVPAEVAAVAVGAGIAAATGTPIAGAPGGGPTPDPVTTNFTFSQIGGMFAVTDTVTTSGRVRLAGSPSSVAFIGSVIFGYVTGDSAILTATQVGGPTPPPANMIQVSVDDGPFAAATQLSDGRYQLFTGLPKVPHKVVVQPNASYSSNCSVSATGTVLTVTGDTDTPPAVEVPQSFVLPGDATTNKTTSNTGIANTRGANYVPGKQRQHSSSVPDKINTLTLTGNIDQLYIACHSKFLFVSVDGAAPTRYDNSVTLRRPFCVRQAVTPGVHTLRIWSADAGKAGADSSGTYPLLAVGARFISGGWQAVAGRRMDQYGDSITVGAGADSQGDTDPYIIAPRMGYTAGTYAVSGQTTAQLEAELLPIFAAKMYPITSDDIAILKIGRNDINNFDATVQAAYSSCISKLLGAGYGKVLCVGLMSENNSFASINTIIQGLVAAAGDARAVYIDVTTWKGLVYDQNDGTHPVTGPTGYGKLADFAQPAYEAALAA